MKVLRVGVMLIWYAYSYAWYMLILGVVAVLNYHNLRMCLFDTNSNFLLFLYFLFVDCFLGPYILIYNIQTYRYMYMHIYIYIYINMVRSIGNQKSKFATLWIGHREGNLFIISLCHLFWQWCYQLILTVWFKLVKCHEDVNKFWLALQEKV